MADNAQELREILEASVRERSLQKAVFSAARNTADAIQRVTARPVMVRGEQGLQFTSQTATQQFHRNAAGHEAAQELVRLATDGFRNIHLTLSDMNVEAKFSRREKCLLRKSPIASTATPPSQINAPSHNRERNHLIPDGTPCPFLIETGVMTSDGKVKAAHSRKFRQINRFLEFIHDVAEILPSDRTIQVVDFGCGKSYLTFATHYLLTHVLNRDCQIVGLDLRKDVVQTCNKIAGDLKLENLSFHQGDIASYRSEEQIDMVISLHACDTATDEAIAQAVRWSSRVILAVPCCQHELNAVITSNALAPLTTYGIAKERFSSLLTDTMRAALLNAIGYQTQLLEFIETEHTPKNLLIRSIRREPVRDSASNANSSLNDVYEMRKTLKVGPLTLERRLTELGRIHVAQ